MVQRGMLQFALASTTIQLQNDGHKVHKVEGSYQEKILPCPQAISKIKDEMGNRNEPIYGTAPPHYYQPPSKRNEGRRVPFGSHGHHIHAAGCS
jgi:hypothetical protein